MKPNGTGKCFCWTERSCENHNRLVHILIRLLFPTRFDERPIVHRCRVQPDRVHVDKHPLEREDFGTCVVTNKVVRQKQVGVFERPHTQLGRVHFSSQRFGWYGFEIHRHHHQVSIPFGRVPIVALKVFGQGEHGVVIVSPRHVFVTIDPPSGLLVTFQQESAQMVHLVDVPTRHHHRRSIFQRRIRGWWGSDRRSEQVLGPWIHQHVKARHYFVSSKKENRF